MFVNFYTFLIAYIFIIISILGYGYLICNALIKSTFTKNIGYVGLTGVFFLTIYSYLTSIFISHVLFHNSLFLSIGFILFFLNKNFFKDYLKNNFHLLVLVFLILLVGLFIFKTHDDFTYYHFQYSYYLTQQPLVVGIGNFGLGLRTTSSLFYLNSLFYLPFIKYFSFQITPVLILGFSNLILLIKIKDDFNKDRYNFLTIYNLSVFIFINTFFYRISEHGTDKSAQILILILFSEILLLINFKAIIEKTISKTFLLIGLIISFKAFYVLYGIFFLVIFYHLLYLKLTLNNILKVFYKNHFFYSLIFIFILILFHNFLISGCLIYPISFSCFDSLWAIKKSEVIELNNWYEQWSKAGAGPNFRVKDPSLYIQNFNWVSNWINNYFFNKVSDFFVGLIFMIIILFFSLRSSQVSIINNKKINLLIFFILILLFEWFYNHPALRYGGYCLISSVLFIYFSIFMEKYKVNKKFLLKKIYTFITITFLIFIYRNYQRINYEVENYNYQPIEKFYYRIGEKQFNLQNDINTMINNYNLCSDFDLKCDQDISETFETTKIYGKYVFFLK